MIQNISFIVIARNESFVIDKCLGPIASIPLKGCEVICVDSNSTDNTLDIMKSYIGKIQNYRIIQCSGYLNAAVARNAGLKYATKQYIFFLDGDVEIDSAFLIESLRLLETGEVDAVSGSLAEKRYSRDPIYITGSVNDRYGASSMKEVSYGSGIFITRSQLVHKVGNWDEAFVRNQDIEYTLRLSRYGRFVIIPVSMGTHHALSYKTRSLEFLFKLYPMFYGQIIRRNLDRPMVLLELFSRNKWMIKGAGLWLALISSLTLLKSFPVYGFWLLGGLGTCFVVEQLLVIAKGKDVLDRLVVHYLYIFVILLGVFLRTNKSHPKTYTTMIS